MPTDGLVGRNLQLLRNEMRAEHEALVAQRRELDERHAAMQRDTEAAAAQVRRTAAEIAAQQAVVAQEAADARQAALAAAAAHQEAVAAQVAARREIVAANEAIVAQQAVVAQEAADAKPHLQGPLLTYILHLPLQQIRSGRFY